MRGDKGTPRRMSVSSGPKRNGTQKGLHLREFNAGTLLKYGQG